MKVKPGVHSFADPIFRVTYIVVCGPAQDFEATVARTLVKRTTATPAERKAIMAALNDSDDGSANNAVAGANGVTFRLRPRVGKNDPMPFVVIWLRPGVGVDVLCHEAWHAAYWVFSGRGHQFDSNDSQQEPMAYYLGWIVRASLGG